MSNRKSGRNIKRTGQAFYRKQAEQVSAMLEYENRSVVLHITSLPTTPEKQAAAVGRVVDGFAKVGMDVSKHVPVFHRKHRHV